MTKPWTRKKRAPAKEKPPPPPKWNVRIRVDQDKALEAFNRNGKP